MLQETLLRLNGLDGITQPIVVCNVDHRFMVAEQLREIDTIAQRIILEPAGRNTAPAVALAALAAHSPEEILLILAADHVIGDIVAFHSAVHQAYKLAEEGNLVTFGIMPTGPETGYGYIRSSTSLGNVGFQIDSFVEKPDLETAQSYFDQGGYYWNSGMFAFKASVYLKELERHNPDILSVCKAAMAAAEQSYDFLHLDKDIFETCPSDSIDYAVMEKTDRAVVIPLDAVWNDVGSWSALWDVSRKNEGGNIRQGRKPHVSACRTTTTRSCIDLWETIPSYTQPYPLLISLYTRYDSRYHGG